jgi:hypothetical protein
MPLQEEIDRWLTETAVGGAGGAGGSGDDDFASSLDPVGKRKRAAGEAAGAPAAKVARSAATGATPQGGVQLDNKVRAVPDGRVNGSALVSYGCAGSNAATSLRTADS